jgi:hypothetical protein
MKKELMIDDLELKIAETPFLKRTQNGISNKDILQYHLSQGDISIVDSLHILSMREDEIEQLLKTKYPKIYKEMFFK